MFNEKQLTNKNDQFQCATKIDVKLTSLFTESNNPVTIIFGETGANFLR
jgi:hypothetical protein